MMKVTPILKKIADYLENPNNEAINLSEDSDEKLIITSKACIEAASILKKAIDDLSVIELSDDLPEDYESCGDCGFDHSYEPVEAGKWHIEHPTKDGAEDFAENAELQNDIRFREGLDDNTDELAQDFKDNSGEPEDQFGDFEDEFGSLASVESIKDLGEISRAFAKSSDPELRKQAALFDELLLTIAAPKDWLEQKKVAESERIDALKKKYKETGVEFNKKNGKDATEKEIKDSGMTKEYRTNEFALSTRYCPDHPTVAIRLLEDRNYSENVAWTGKEYSFVNGYTLDNGDKVPGGTVENQGNFDHIDHFTMFENRR